MPSARYSIHRRCVLRASVDSTWEELRDFTNVCKVAFRDQVENVHWIEGGSVKHVPALVRFTLQPGDNQITEQVAGRSEIDRSITFRTVGPALSFADYVATMRCMPLTDEANKCVFEWSMEFSLIKGTNADEFLPMYESLVDQQIANFKGHFGGV